jgi:hypothetical protein
MEVNNKPKILPFTFSWDFIVRVLPKKKCTMIFKNVSNYTQNQDLFLMYLSWTRKNVR